MMKRKNFEIVRKKSITRNQKVDLIKNAKETIVTLTTSNVKQIKRILLKVIEMLKNNLRKKIDSQSKLSLTLNRIENRFLTIEK